MAAIEVEPGEFFLYQAYQYADDVRSGKILACHYVKCAVNRWYDDLAYAHDRGYIFNENAAAKVFNFVYQYCKHYQGEWAGKPVELSPWQCFAIANIFGWVRISDGRRRFSNVYEEVARKNGKTTKLGAIGAYLATGDNEPGAKVYCAATKREQARELFDAIGNMSKKDKTLNQAMNVLQNKIVCETRNSPNSQVVLLSKDYNSMDGFNVHAGLVDEVHAHPDDGIWSVLESGRGARRQPIMWGITTAGKNHNSFCYELRSYGVKILEGSIPVEECDTTFVMIFTLDEGDDWTDPDVWVKANPNLGISVSLQDMIQQAQKAKEMPSARIEFQTKRLNMWVYGETAWMNMEKWNACKTEQLDEKVYWQEGGETDLDGEECCGGIDLASVEDLSALSFDFKLPNGKHRFLSRGYIPELAFEKRMKKGGHIRALYIKFRDQGSLIVTPGDTCDYDFIKKDVLQFCQRFNVKEIAYDRWNSSQLVNDLVEEEIVMVAMGQGTGSINAPMKEMLRLALSEQIEHNNDLLTFAMSNVVSVSNAQDDIKFDKSKVSEKIDPAASTIMALSRSMIFENDGSAALDEFLKEPLSL
jgi:phage terminase large subunit-like protein